MDSRLKPFRFLLAFAVILAVFVAVPAIDAARTTTAMVRVVLGSSDCPVKIYRPTSDWAIPYTYADGVANAAKLNTLFAAWGSTGATTGVIQLPPGVLYTVGTVMIPRNVICVIEGCSGPGVYYADVQEYTRGYSRWHMEKATGAGAFCPGVFLQSFGCEVRNICFTTRHRRLTSDAYTGTPPSQMWYIAPADVVSGNADYVTGTAVNGSTITPSAEAGGTGKHTFEFCFVNNSANVPFVQTCHVSRPTSLNADTVTFNAIQHFGSGQLVLSASEQNVKLVINDLYFEGFDTPVIVDSYKVAGVTINDGTLAHPCTLVKLRSEVVAAQPIVKINGLQLDNNATPTCVIFDGFDATSNLTSLKVSVRDANFPYEDTSANGPYFKMSGNQSLKLDGCTYVTPGNLFATKNVTRTAYGETNYVFRPTIKVQDCLIYGQYATGGTTSLSTLRNAAGSTHAYYNLRVDDNHDLLGRWFDEASLDVAP